MRRRNLGIAAMLLALAGTGQHEAGAIAAGGNDCDTRHFYNTSPVTFSIRFTGGTCSIGSFKGIQCSIPAGSTADLHYGNVPETTADITIASSPDTIFPAKKFRVGRPGNDCYIQHGGGTGNIVGNRSEERR